MSGSLRNSNATTTSNSVEQRARMGSKTESSSGRPKSQSCVSTPGSGYATDGQSSNGGSLPPTPNTKLHRTSTSSLPTITPTVMKRVPLKVTSQKLPTSRQETKVSAQLPGITGASKNGRGPGARGSGSTPVLKVAIKTPTSHLGPSGAQFRAGMIAKKKSTPSKTNGQAATLMIQGTAPKSQRLPARLPSLASSIEVQALKMERPLTLNFKVVLMPKIALDMAAKMGYSIQSTAIPAPSGGMLLPAHSVTEIMYKMSSYHKKGLGLRVVEADKDAWKITCAVRATICPIETFQHKLTGKGHWTMRGDVSGAKKNWEQTYFAGSKKFFPPLPMKGKAKDCEKILQTDTSGSMLWAPNRQPTSHHFRCPHCNKLNALPSNPAPRYHCGICSQIFDTSEPQGVEDLSSQAPTLQKTEKKRESSERKGADGKKTNSKRSSSQKPTKKK